MDWSDAALNFGTSRLSKGIEEFTNPTLKAIWDRALVLFDDIRSCRVTLDYLRAVDAVEFISGKKHVPTPRGEVWVESVSKPLDKSTAEQVKGYLERRVEEYRKKVQKEYSELVPEQKEGFEEAFEAFVERCLNGAERSWFEHQVEMGCGQPHLRKAFVVFQKQLRKECEKRARQGLPAPLFDTVPQQAENKSAKEKEKGVQYRRVRFGPTETLNKKENQNQNRQRYQNNRRQHNGQPGQNSRRHFPHNEKNGAKNGGGGGGWNRGRNYGGNYGGKTMYHQNGDKWYPKQFRKNVANGKHNGYQHKKIRNDGRDPRGIQVAIIKPDGNFSTREYTGRD